MEVDLNIGEVVEDDRLVTRAVRRLQLVRFAQKGVPAKRAAQITGASYPTVLAVYQEPAFRRQVLEKVESAFVGVDEAYVDEKRTLHERLGDVAEDAFDGLVEMLSDENTPKTLKVRIAQDFLDRHEPTMAGSKSYGLTIDATQLVVAAKTAREVDDG